ncbi:MAG: spermidine/putrescine ABC transporter substrate-binding protein [Anaerolineae bacterium]|nr:spermidine/putrescine ABC transporter substrate-binding protein [Anaerolineae bacterium]
MHKVLVTLWVASLLLVGAARVGAQGDASEWQCPAGFEGQTLRILSFTQYIGEDIIPRFEELCGVTVEYDATDSSEAVLLLLRERTAPYDIIVPSGDVLGRMINEGLLYELNQENIPNLANLSEAFADPIYDPGNRYSIAYVWGLLAVGYNAELIEEPITSWYDVFNYDGPVAWQDDLRMMLGTALMLLGYDPSTTNPDEIAEARDFLIENSENVVTVAGDDGQVLLEQFVVDIAIEWNGDIVQLAADCECDDFRFVIPEEGALTYVDNLAIPANAENPALAEVFMDFILDPHIGAENINYIAYGTPNQAALDLELVDEALLNDPTVYPPAETFETLQTAMDIPEVEDLYFEAWNEVLLSLSN